ncbi:MAG: hypothetical protein KDA32_15420, partial [Phycisphaerales bacterium]|nr:hypothetical protein [Phycisphaerales bacterium]
MRKWFAISAALWLSAPVWAAGGDIIVGDLYSPAHWGQVGNIRAYSIGTISCNLGDTSIPFNSSTPNHPVIAQNMYRLRDGRFEQIGQSWLKHAFAALSGNVCGTCQGGGGGLGPGCSDPYSGGLNGSAGRLGPRSEVNVYTGTLIPNHATPSGDTTLAGRVQVLQADLEPAQNAGARYF